MRLLVAGTIFALCCGWGGKTQAEANREWNESVRLALEAQISNAREACKALGASHFSVTYHHAAGYSGYGYSCQF